jgi:hypothetical protein
MGNPRFERRGSSSATLLAPAASFSGTALALAPGTDRSVQLLAANLFDASIPSNQQSTRTQTVCKALDGWCWS